MRILAALVLVFFSSVGLASGFSSSVKLCAYLLNEENERFLLFNFKTRSQVIIKLKGKNLEKLGKGPYFFDLKILNPQYKKNEYVAEILRTTKCRGQNVVRFVDGELRARK